MLTRRDLNRTLRLRQHLLARAAVPALEMVEHLVGLPAQENLSPYLVRDLTRAERSELDDEVGRVETLLSR